jgi:serine/threonine-protein kinase
VSRSDPPPQKIGRYAVERLLGQGGMGRVWLARDTVLGRRVAIKVLRDDLALPPSVRDELLVRMGHEARAAAAVSHPNIVTLYDMGEDDILGLFLVFEYVTTRDGKVANEAPDASEAPLSLRDRLKRGALPLAEVAKLAREVGSALSFAHEAEVIHRDVKPENILFSRTGFKIADFGIARIPDSTITRANTVLGTPAYTAPEALSKGDFGEASDQFSLAATLYEAATGRRAFAGDDAIVTAGKVSSEPPPPLDAEIGAEAVVHALDAVLQKGLAKGPEGRFASCAELGQEVARVIETEAGTRRAPSGRPLGQPTPVPGLLELERTPLSSRASRVTLGEPGPVRTSLETPRPSLFQRQRTQRFQNVAAGLALVVIVALILVGRKTPSPPGVDDDAGVAASATSTPAGGLPTTNGAHRPGHVRLHPSTSPAHASASASAGAPPSSASAPPPPPLAADAAAED